MCTTMVRLGCWHSLDSCLFQKLCKTRRSLSLPQHWPLPLFQPVPFSLNNGELSFSTVWCSANTTSLTSTLCSLLYVCMFPRCLISHSLVQVSHMCVRCVCVCVCFFCWVLVSRPVRMCGEGQLLPQGWGTQNERVRNVRNPMGNPLWVF